MAQQNEFQSVDSNRNRPAPGTKLEVIAYAARAVLRAEARPKASVAGPGPFLPQHESERERLERIFSQEPLHGQLTYHQRALRGDLGDDEKARALAAYNKGEQLDDPASRGPGATLVADRPDGSESSTTVSADEEALQQKAAQSGQAPGASPAEVVAAAPTIHAGAQASTKSTTVVTDPATKPAKK